MRRSQSIADVCTLPSMCCQRVSPPPSPPPSICLDSQADLSKDPTIVAQRPAAAANPGRINRRFRGRVLPDATVTRVSPGTIGTRSSSGSHEAESTNQPPVGAADAVMGTPRGCMRQKRGRDTAEGGDQNPVSSNSVQLQGPPHHPLGLENAIVPAGRAVEVVGDARPAKRVSKPSRVVREAAAYKECGRRVARGADPITVPEGLRPAQSKRIPKLSPKAAEAAAGL